MVLAILLGISEIVLSHETTKQAQHSTNHTDHTKQKPAPQTSNPAFLQTNPVEVESLVLLSALAALVNTFFSGELQLTCCKVRHLLRVLRQPGDIAVPAHQQAFYWLQSTVLDSGGYSDLWMGRSTAADYGGVTATS
jgi:hypothetical protein